MSSVSRKRTATLKTRRRSKAGHERKAAKGGTKGKAVTVPQLYDLQSDPAEEHNLAESSAEKLSELRALLTTIRGVE